MSEREIALSTGVVVRVRPIPSHDFFAIGADIKVPPQPTVPVKSAAGHTENIKASEDSPEFQAWAEQLNDIRRKQGQAKDNFMFDYAVVAWKLPGGQWQTDEPEGWTDRAMQRAGRLTDNRRADYIRSQVVPLGRDYKKVFDYAFGESEPVTEQEVEAQLDGFRPEESGGEASAQV